MMAFSASPKCPSPHRSPGAADAGLKPAASAFILASSRTFLPRKKAHPALLTDNLAALVHALEAAGYAIAEDQPLEKYDRRFVHDPFGNRIELMQPR